MRRTPLQAARLALLLALVAATPSRAEPYRADRLRPVGPGAPRAVTAWPPPGARWPAPLLAELERELLRDWPADLLYGSLGSSIGVWLEYPLVARRLDRTAWVPVTAAAELPIRGRLERLAPAGPRRVVVLVDASSSANARTSFTDEHGRLESVPVLEAELRALEHLLDAVADAPVEIGVVAFGETTWPLAPPGTSQRELRAALERFRREHPRGVGRTDTVCAFWTAWDWLRETPNGTGRELVLLTDGDLPYSGRFLDCSRVRGAAREACEARRNQSACPASRRMGGASSHSDVVQLDHFARRFRSQLRISPVVFEADRSARAYRLLAEETGGAFVQAPSVRAAAAALPTLVAGRPRAVHARNRGTGVRTGNLLGPDGTRFSGALPLARGANDVELVVEGERGTAARFRFRVYAAAGDLARYLADLRRTNRALERRAELLRRAAQPPAAVPAARELEVAAEP